MKNCSAKNARSIFGMTILLFLTSCSKDSSPSTPNQPPSGIVYTYVGTDSVIIDASKQTYSLDLNKDGKTDIQFLTGSEGCGEDLGTQVDIAYISTIGCWTTADGIYLASALDSASVIDSSSLWMNNPLILRGALNQGYIRCMLTEGHWFNVSEGYLGVKFQKGTDTLYGWLRLSSSYGAVSQRGEGSKMTGGQIKLIDYAYNSAPAQPILAGQKK
jgi:hypothetical protein